MELVILDTLYQRQGIVENYDTLAWTERYDDTGDFQLTSTDIQAIREMLPIDSFITLQDTNQVMIVENHAIAPDELGVYTVTITGRTLESIFDRRIAVHHDGTKLVLSGSKGNMAMQIMNMFAPGHVLQTNGNDQTGDYLPMFYATIEAGADVDDNAGYTTDIPIGYALDTIRNLLNSQGAGVRVDRSDKSQPGKLNFVVYKGRDLTKSTGAPGFVVLNEDNGDVTNAQYVMSKKNLKTHFYPLRPTQNGDPYIDTNYIMDVNGSTALPGLIGLDRRDYLFDMSSDDVVVDPGQTFTPDFAGIAKRELTPLKTTGFISAGVSPFADPSYGVVYYLGDTITLDGKFGISGDFQVTGYTRTQDSYGESSYPTFKETIT